MSTERPKFFSNDRRTAYEAKAEAQRIAFAPVMFQACRVLRDSGLLELVHGARAAGLTLQEAAARSSLPRYGIKVLLEAGLGAGLFCLNENRFTITRLGHFVLRDPMTRANMDAVHHVFYRGFFHLEESIKEGRPAGLRTLGPWKTVYEGLSSLGPEARASWLAWDHFYSDGAFPAALPLVFADRPRRLLDVGGNTGKWAVQCARFDPAVQVTIADLPQQLELARQTLRSNDLEDRVELLGFDALDDSVGFPAGYDAIWMSQFLDCFSEQQIVSILRRAGRALGDTGALFILELFWDRQPNETAAFCLQQSSLYFACIANGNSQMYHSDDLRRCIVEAGLQIVEEHDQVGSFHTLLKCRPGKVGAIG